MRGRRSEDPKKGAEGRKNFGGKGTIGWGLKKAPPVICLGWLVL
jgi:hypothetical protein